MFSEAAARFVYPLDVDERRDQTNPIDNATKCTFVKVSCIIETFNERCGSVQFGSISGALLIKVLVGEAFCPRVNRHPKFDLLEDQQRCHVCTCRKLRLTFYSLGRPAKYRPLEIRSSALPSLLLVKDSCIHKVNSERVERLNKWFGLGQTGSIAGALSIQLLI